MPPNESEKSKSEDIGEEGRFRSAYFGGFIFNDLHLQDHEYMESSRGGKGENPGIGNIAESVHDFHLSRHADWSDSGRLFKNPPEFALRRQSIVAGHISDLVVVSDWNSLSLECTFQGKLGQMSLVFLGRDRVPGLVVGTELKVCGTPGFHAGRIEMVNPLYEIVSEPESIQFSLGRMA